VTARPESSPVRLGIIGTGLAVRRLHAPALLHLADDLVVRTICGRNPKRARRLAEALACDSICTSAEEALAMADVDAFLIAVPIGLSAQLATLALRAGKHVLVEKPLAATLEQAEELVELSRTTSPLVAMVAENFRFWPLTATLRRLLWTENAIGAPRLVYCNSVGHIDLSKQADWRAQPAYPGGYLLDGGVHFAAMLRELFGDPEELVAIGRPFDARLGGPIGLTAHFRSEHGVEVVWNFLRTSCPGAPRTLELQVFGEEGSITVGPGDRLTVHAGRQDHPTPLQLDPGTGHTEQLRAFVAAVRSGGATPSSFQDGWKDMKLVLRALQSARQARPA
jgi:predicted dehydrogenase